MKAEAYSFIGLTGQEVSRFEIPWEGEMPSNNSVYIEGPAVEADRVRYLKESRGEYCRFQCGGTRSRGIEKAHIHIPVYAVCAADLLAEARSGGSVRAELDKVFSAGYISSGAGNTAARVFNQRASYNIRSRLCGLCFFDEFAVTVINHNDGIAVFMNKSGDFANFRDREARP